MSNYLNVPSDDSQVCFYGESQTFRLKKRISYIIAQIQFSIKRFHICFILILRNPIFAY